MDTDKPLVTLDNPDELVTSIALNLPNCKIEIKESDQYARKLGKILENPRIKEEMGEQMIATYEQKTGIIFKKTIGWYVTNYRIMCIDETNCTVTQIPLKYADIVIRNTHTFSERTGAIAGGLVGGFITSGMAFTQGQSTSRRIGDINFLLGDKL